MLLPETIRSWEQWPNEWTNSLMESYNGSIIKRGERWEVGPPQNKCVSGICPWESYFTGSFSFVSFPVSWLPQSELYFPDTFSSPWWFKPSDIMNQNQSPPPPGLFIMKILTPYPQLCPWDSNSAVPGLRTKSSRRWENAIWQQRLGRFSILTHCVSHSQLLLHYHLQMDLEFLFLKSKSLSRWTDSLLVFLHRQLKSQTSPSW